MTRSRSLSLISALAFAALATPTLAGCDQLLGQLPGQELPPDVKVGTLQLRRSPSIGMLAAYYCPKISSDPVVRLTCTVALGPAPAKSQLSFEFGIVLNMHNPNDIPVPTADVLLGLTLFDGVDAEALAAICISLCGQDNPNCDGTPRPGACQVRQDDILTIEDFIVAIPGLIADIASGEAAKELNKSTILAGGDISLDLAFILGVDQALSVFQKTAESYVEAELGGGDGSLDIPVAAEGTVFFDLPVLGRLGVGFGPFQTVWRVL